MIKKMAIPIRQVRHLPMFAFVSCAFLSLKCSINFGKFIRISEEEDEEEKRKREKALPLICRRLKYLPYIFKK